MGPCPHEWDHTSYNEWATPTGHTYLYNGLSNISYNEWNHTSYVMNGATPTCTLDGATPPTMNGATPVMNGATPPI